MKYKTKNSMAKCLISVFALHMPINAFATSGNEASPLPHTYNGINTDEAVVLQNELLSDPSLLVFLALGFLGLGVSLTKNRQA